MKDSFTVGEVYFRVKYAEPARKYPLIESFVFVGRNLSDEDTEDTRYFQFGASFAKHGSILKSSGGDRRVACLTANELLGDMLDDRRLLKELSAARSRRHSDPSG
jgi:hypothetical protein